MSYDVGDVVALGIIVTNDAGTQVDTTPVTCTITLPDGTTATPTVANPSVGEYSVQYTTTQAGRYVYRWVAGGGYPGAHGDTFYVLSSAGLLIGLDEAKAYLNMPTADTSDDEELRHFLDTVSQFAEAKLGQVFARQAVTATCSGGSPAVVVNRLPVLSVTSVTENGTTLDAAGYAADPDSGVITRLSGAYASGCWASGFNNVTVVYVAGYAAPPQPVRHGALAMVKHLWETQRGTFAPARAGADETIIPGTSYSLPRRVVELWEPYESNMGFA